MKRLPAFITAVGIVGVTALVDTQGRRPPAGSDYFAGSWMVNPTKTVNWTGRDNTTFEYIQFEVENDVQKRDVETGYGVADATGIHRHNRRRNSVKYNEFDPAKAGATDLSVYGNDLPPMSPRPVDNHLVTLKVDDRTHISFNKSGGGFFRHMAADLKEYVYVGFTEEGRVPLHRWSSRIKKAGDPNLPDVRSLPN